MEEIELVEFNPAAEGFVLSFSVQERCGRSPVGQQEVHEYEAFRGGPKDVSIAG